MSLVTRCTEFLRLHGALARERTLLVAASGGCDSTVLSAVMGEIARRWSLRLVLAYVHHGLRPEAEEEAAFVRGLAARCDASFALRRVDVRAARERDGGSVQEVARTLRYQALEDMRVEYEADAILLAHHADDQAETVLAHFLRGSGVRGMAGMRAVRGALLRPFLSETRATLERWAAEQQLSWRHDASNDSDAYARNALRHHVIPAIRDHAGAGWPSTVVDAARLFQSLDTFLSAHVDGLAGQCLQRRGAEVHLAVQPLKGYFAYEQLALLRHALSSLRGSVGLYDEVFSLQRLIDAVPGKRAVLRGGFLAFREKDALVIRPSLAQPGTIDVVPDADLSYGAAAFAITRCATDAVRFHRDPAEEFIDLERTGMALQLRPWTDDDMFTPFGSVSATRVASFLAAAGYAARERGDIPVLVGQHGIVWVCGVRLDRHAALRSESSAAARLTFHEQIRHR